MSKRTELENDGRKQGDLESHLRWVADYVKTWSKWKRKILDAPKEEAAIEQ